MNTNSLKPHDCPACGGWKADGQDYCGKCCDYRDRLLRQRRERQEFEEEQKRASYWNTKI